MQLYDWMIILLVATTVGPSTSEASQVMELQDHVHIETYNLIGTGRDKLLDNIAVTSAVATGPHATFQRTNERMHRPVMRKEKRSEVSASQVPWVVTAVCIAVWTIILLLIAMWVIRKVRTRRRSVNEGDTV